jgi:hypothetical protein
VKEIHECDPVFKLELLYFHEKGGMYLVSATPTKLFIEFLWNFTQL